MATHVGGLRALTTRPQVLRVLLCALVDGQGRIGALDTVFFDTLLDENAASHIALGAAFGFAVSEEDRERLNRSAIHVDFMIGGPGVDVAGVTAAGEEVPVLRGGAWQV